VGIGTQIIVATAVVFSLLGLLFWARRMGWATFGSAIRPAPRAKSMQVLERINVTAQHSVVLLEIDHKRMLVCLSPGGSSVTHLETSQ
jgi:flagellar biogenesis protein FliO